VDRRLIEWHDPLRFGAPISLVFILSVDATKALGGAQVMLEKSGESQRRSFPQEKSSWITRRCIHCRAVEPL
jgi:hypothetical protein